MGAYEMKCNNHNILQKSTYYFPNNKIIIHYISVFYGHIILWIGFLSVNHFKIILVVAIVSYKESE